MPQSEPSILTGWWHFAVRALTALTARADVDACDRAVEQLARDSVAGAAVHRASETLRGAWATSQFRAWSLSLVTTLAPAPAAAAWRVAGWIVSAAGVTVLGLNRFTSNSIDPLNWVVPAALVAAGLLLMAAAAPLSRAAADRRLRHKVS